MKKIISVMLALLMIFSQALAVPFVQLYDEAAVDAKIIKVISEGNYIFALSENSEIFIYDISDSTDIKSTNKISREGFTVKDMAIAKSRIIISYVSEDESHISIIRLTDIPGWNEGSSFGDFNAITAAVSDIETSENFVYYKSQAENQIYVGGWARGSTPVLGGTLGDEYMNIITSEKYMYMPSGNLTEVYDISSSYSGTKVTDLALTGISKAVTCGEYIIIAAGSEVKVYNADFTEAYSYDAEGVIADMELSGNNLWIYTETQLQLLDTADFTLKSKATVAGKGDIAASGDLAFEPSDKGINIYRNLPYEVTDAEYTSANGEITYSANFANYTNDDIAAEIYMLILKDGKTLAVANDALQLTANVSTSVEITAAATEEGCQIITLIIDRLSNLNALSAEYVNEKIVSYAKIQGTVAKNPEYAGEESIAISEIDEYGNVTIGGVSTAKSDRPVTVAVTYGGAVSYLNSVIAEDGSYGFTVKPAGYGAYNVTVNDGGIKYTGSFEIAAPILKVGAHIEDMGRQTYITMNAANMQNAENILFEMPYDASALEFEAEPEILGIMDGFEVESISAANGVLSISMNKTGAVTSSEAEFLKIAVKTSETATEGVYNLTPNMQVTDILGNTVVVQVTGGTVEIREVLEKYNAIDAAEAVLATVKASFTETDYRAQVTIVADANAKIEYALSNGAREYDFDSSLMNTLKSAEAVLAQYKDKFDAVDAINAAVADNIDAEVDKHIKTLEINGGLWNMYKESGIDKTAVRTKLEAYVFDLPAKVNQEMAEIIITGLIEKTQWSGMDKIITDLGEAFGFGDSRYADLTTAAKKNVGMALAGKTFVDIATLKAALKTAIDTYYSTPTGGGISGGSGSGGKGSVSSNVSFVASQPAAQPDSQKPESYKDTLIFGDLGEAEWAREAIEYLAKEEIINGTGGNCFTPGGNVTREAFVKMLVGALEITSDVESEFTDVDKNAWYYSYINAAAGKGIITGYADGSFGIGKNITREEMAVIIKRAIDFCGIILEDKNDRVIFDDGDEISLWAKESITAMQKAGIINGVSETEFAPKSNATRAQAAKLIYEITQLKAGQGV